ncbi:hypothetical protein GCM10027160_25740 [Streptomyces calidiresistens]
MSTSDAENTDPRENGANGRGERAAAKERPRAGAPGSRPVPTPADVFRRKRPAPPPPPAAE